MYSSQASLFFKLHIMGSVELSSIIIEILCFYDYEMTIDFDPPCAGLFFLKKLGRRGKNRGLSFLTYRGTFLGTYVKIINDVL